MRGLRLLALWLVAVLATPGAAQVAGPGKTADPAKKEPAPTAMELNGKGVSAWVKELRNNDPSVREEAIRAIMVFGKEASTKEVVQVLLERLLDKDASPRMRAIQALASLDITDDQMPKVVQAVAARLTEDPQAVVRAQAALAFCVFGKKAAPVMGSLIKGANDPTSWEIRRACVHAIGEAGQNGPTSPPDTKAVQALLTCLKDPALHVRMEAIFSLGKLGQPADPTLKATAESELSRLANDKDRAVSIWAWMSLMTITGINEAAIKAIREHLRHEDPRVRATAAKGLAQLGSAARFAVVDLAKLLKDKDTGVASAAIFAIAQIDEPGLEAMAGLKALADDKDGNDFLKRQAQGALDYIKKVNKMDKPDKKP